MSGEKQRGTWRLIIGGLLVGTTLISGLLMNVSKPVWFAPPLSRTVLVYLAVGMAWIPVGMVCAWIVRRDLPRRTLLPLIMIVTLVGAVAMCTVAPSKLNYNLLIPEATVCEEQQLAGERVRYTCTLTAFYYYEVYTLEGSQNSPFLRLMNFETGGS